VVKENDCKTPMWWQHEIAKTKVLNKQGNSQMADIADLHVGHLFLYVF